MYEATPKNFETVWNRAEREAAGPWAGVFRSMTLPLGAFLRDNGSSVPQQIPAATGDAVGFGLHGSSNSLLVLTWNGTSQTAVYYGGLKLPRTITKHYDKRDLKLVVTMDKSGGGTDNADLGLTLQAYTRYPGQDSDSVGGASTMVLDAKAADLSGMREYVFDLGALIDISTGWTPGTVLTLQLTPDQAIGFDLNLNIAAVELEWREHLNPVARV